MDIEPRSNLAQELAELRRTLCLQGARIAELEEELAGDDVAERETSTRRGMLRLAGAAVVGGVGASLIGTQPAAATTGAMQFGASNDAGEVSTTLESIVATGAPTLRIENNADGEGIQVQVNSGTGQAGIFVGNDGAAGKGVWVNAVGTVAVEANSLGASGVAVLATGGRAQLLLSPMTGSTAPTSGSHVSGELVANAGGFFACVADGTPGTWRKIAGSATGGAFHPITPTRVYDSRAPLPTPGILATGANRLVSVADGRDNNGTVTTPNLVPAGATAVAANITVTGTTGGFGYLAINPGGNTVEGASTINWFGAGQTIANGVTLTLNTTRQLTVICNGGGTTNFLIDIAGYYL